MNKRQWHDRRAVKAGSKEPKKFNPWANFVKWTPITKPANLPARRRGQTTWGCRCRRRQLRAAINDKFHANPMYIKIARKIVDELKERKRRAAKFAQMQRVDAQRRCEFQVRELRDALGEA